VSAFPLTGGHAGVVELESDMKILKNVLVCLIGSAIAFAICLRSQHILEARLGQLEDRLEALLEAGGASAPTCPAALDAKTLAVEITRTVKLSCPDNRPATGNKEATALTPSGGEAMQSYQRGREIVEAMYSSHQWGVDKMTALTKELAALGQDKRNELAQEVVNAINSGDVVSEIPGPFF
jgi:hypothetical protein